MKKLSLFFLLSIHFVSFSMEIDQGNQQEDHTPPNTPATLRTFLRDKKRRIEDSDDDSEYRRCIKQKIVKETTCLILRRSQTYPGALACHFMLPH